MKRVAVIGLDAVEPQLVDRLIAEGQLPTLARLQRSGATCRLHSEATWRSGRVWETLLTGDADYPSAASFDPATYQSHLLGARLKTPFYAKIPGVNLLALDVPYMSLWYDVPGAQIVWGGHDTGYPRASRPAGLVKQLDARFGAHPAFHNDFDCAWHHAPAIHTLADALIVGARRRVDVCGWLLEQFPNWNLFMTVLSEAHSAGEAFWLGVDDDHPLSQTPNAAVGRQRLLDVYREVDRSLAALLERLPRDTTVLVTSVHGMEPNDYDVPSMALLPELLHRASFGKALLRGPNPRRWRREGCPPVIPGPRLKWNHYMRYRFDAGPLQRMWGTLHRALGSPRLRARPIQDLTVPIPPETDRSPQQIAEPRSQLNWQFTCRYRKYWPKMKAFALPVFYDGRVRINLRSRERDGIVEPADYHRTCDWVEQLLAECRNPRTGQPALANVERLRADAPLDPDGPDADLVITWNAAVDALEHPRHGMIGPVPFRRTGGHTNRGFAHLVGPGIAAQDWGEQEALRLTPTIMSLLGAGCATETILGCSARAA